MTSDRAARNGRHYWLTPPDLYAQLDAEFGFDFDPCPWPRPEGFDGLIADWGRSSFCNPPFYSGVSAWARKAIAESQAGKRVVLVAPVDKCVMRLWQAAKEVRDLGDVRWCATEDGSVGPGTGRYIACFVLGGR